MHLHLFRDGDTDVFAFTTDRSGNNLPCTQESCWYFVETLAPVRFAWGADEFGEVCASIAATGFYLFEGEMQPLPSSEPPRRRSKPRAAG
jgi:hypothetical protein